LNGGKIAYVTETPKHHARREVLVPVHQLFKDFSMDATDRTIGREVGVGRDGCQLN